MSGRTHQDWQRGCSCPGVHVGFARGLGVGGDDWEGVGDDGSGGSGVEDERLGTIVRVGPGRVRHFWRQVCGFAEDFPGQM